MELANLTLDELELMSYSDITYLLLKENKQSMDTPSLFKKICELLDYSESTYSDKIGDFYTSLTTDKRFIQLPNNEWDLRDNHSIDIVLDDEEDEDIDAEELEEEEMEEETEEEDTDTLYDDESDITDDDDDIDDLSIIDEDSLEEE
jgi:DNA-directed RNA polymerase delta subunit